jgi:hypothetical protein
MSCTADVWYPPSCGTGSFLFANLPFRTMTTIIPNRDIQHGGMEAVGAIEQPIKDLMRSGSNWSKLSPGSKSALDMIAQKIARILSGSNPHDPQHWEDLAGYPEAAMRDWNQ